MASTKVAASLSSSSSQVLQQNLQKYGFLHIRNFLDISTVKSLHEVFPRLFRGEFVTGIYPDEWHWREGISKESSTREICNAWKSDPSIASVVLHRQLGEFISHISGWNSVRIGQDDVIWKPPNMNSSPIGYHQDSAYISNQFVPRDNNSFTVWMALDDADEESGTIEYIPGSHLWDGADSGDHTLSSFHGVINPNDTDSNSNNICPHRLPVLQAAALNGMDAKDIEFLPITVKAGDMIVHHQDIWHGSGPNLSLSSHRRALVSHVIKGDIKFKDGHYLDNDNNEQRNAPNYIYGKYKMLGSNELNENFFPIIYADNNNNNFVRSSFLKSYIDQKESNNNNNNNNNNDKIKKNNQYNIVSTDSYDHDKKYKIFSIDDFPITN